jgi:hypothetical protein
MPALDVLSQVPVNEVVQTPFNLSFWSYIFILDYSSVLSSLLILSFWTIASSIFIANPRLTLSILLVVSPLPIISTVSIMSIDFTLSFFNNFKSCLYPESSLHRESLKS